jgi:hypothetical protein
MGMNRSEEPWKAMENLLWNSIKKPRRKTLRNTFDSESQFRDSFRQKCSRNYVDSWTSLVECFPIISKILGKNSSSFIPLELRLKSFSSSLRAVTEAFPREISQCVITPHIVEAMTTAANGSSIPGISNNNNFTYVKISQNRICRL